MIKTWQSIITVCLLIFIHHSCGENWLADGNGGLGLALRDNNYLDRLVVNPGHEPD